MSASAADILRPCWANVIVRLEEPRTEGADSSIVIPDTVRESRGFNLGKSRRARVVSAGPEAWVKPGQLVHIDYHAGQTLSTAGERNVVQIESSEIRAVEEEVDGAEDDDESVIVRLIPPPGICFLERCEMPIQRGRIVVPGGINLRTRSNEATVIRSIDGAPFTEGDTVLLGGTITRGVRVGRRHLLLATPRQVPAIVVDNSDIIDSEESPLRNAVPVEIDYEDKFDEGDSLGVR